METRKIGSLEVSVVGLGTNNFGARIDEASSRAVVAACLEHGINFFDTADIYGGTASEAILGSALARRRDEAVIATKFGMKVDDARSGGAKPDYVRRAAEESLQRLQTDRIDLYILHQPDEETPIADTLGALDELVSAGKVREIGCSNFNAAQLEEAAAAATGAHFVNLQNEYSLLDRSVEAEILPTCDRLGISFVPYFPLGGGLLTGKYRGGELPSGARLTNLPEERRNRFYNERNLSIVDKVHEFASARGHSVLDAAISFLLTRAGVASVIAGATRPEQVVANAAAAAWSLSPADQDELSRLST